MGGNGGVGVGGEERVSREGHEPCSTARGSQPASHRAALEQTRWRDQGETLVLLCLNFVPARCLGTLSESGEEECLETRRQVPHGLHGNICSSH